MLTNCRDIWERDYAHLAPHKRVKKRDAFKEWLCCKKGESTITDEFRRYFTAGSAIPVTEKFDPRAWWDIEEGFSTLQRRAFDVSSHLATSCECERAFNIASKLITPERTWMTT